MPDEKWDDIFGPQGRGQEYQAIVRPSDPYADAPRSSVPRVIAPKCEDHCSGRHEIDSVLSCPKCRVAGYKVILHEYKHSDGHYFVTLAPINGSPEWTQKGTPICRDCQVEFSRE